MNELGSTPDSQWNDWKWQIKNSIYSKDQFEKNFKLNQEEKEVFLSQNDKLFNIRSTPYYNLLASSCDSIKKIMMPHSLELKKGKQEMLDPLGEKNNQKVNRVIHRYSDRVLFLVTDMCSVYCRYCTRKHFTGHEQSFLKSQEYEEALNYIKSHEGIREVILSGGDPLTLSDSILEKVLSDLRQIEHIEIIRIGTRMPVVCPMRITNELVQIFKNNKPVFVMTHFNHPKEITLEAANALELMVDNGVPVFNQMVLLNGINNHHHIVQALSRRLLFLRVKPYYMFQCDPSEGSDHLRTSIEESEAIQKELWGHLSGLAMPVLSLDIPNGGGKTTLVPQFEVERQPIGRKYIGWDGVHAEYINPSADQTTLPKDYLEYESEWNLLTNAKRSHLKG